MFSLLFDTWTLYISQFFPIMESLFFPSHGKLSEFRHSSTDSEISYIPKADTTSWHQQEDSGSWSSPLHTASAETSILSLDVRHTQHWQLSSLLAGSLLSATQEHACLSLLLHVVPWGLWDWDRSIRVGSVRWHFYSTLLWHGNIETSLQVSKQEMRHRPLLPSGL